MFLRKGLIASCGCLRKEVSSKTMTRLNTKHGLSRTKEYKTHYATKHTMAKRKQVPPWADVEKIKQIYLNRPKGFHVDHIIPLQGKLVSGLHVENNLQYLPAKENMSHLLFEFENHLSIFYSSCAPAWDEMRDSCWWWLSQKHSLLEEASFIE